MKKINFNNLDQDVYTFTLKNGLKVFLVPYKNKKNYYAILGTKYGSSNIEFNYHNKKVKSPYGLAHFLEHKMFEQEDGTDIMKEFAKLGISSNASTTFANTRYYIFGVNELIKGLDILIDFVYSPCFKPQSVEKEKGIIKEEILMYEDSPEWVLDDTMRKNLFYNLPAREKIAGTIDSINKITKDDLYKAYETFYNPSNMCLVIGGNINHKELEKYLKENKKLNSLEKKDNLEKTIYNEPDDVHEEYKKIHMNINIPKIEFSIKVNRDKLKPFDNLKIDMYLGILSTIFFGNTSDFREYVISNNIANGFYGEKSDFDNFTILSLVAESERADIFIDKVKETIKNLKISKKDLERVKRVWIASEIRMIDNIEITCDNIYSDIIFQNKLCDNRIDIIRSLNISELRKFIKLLDLSNQSLVMLLPNEH